MISMSHHEFCEVFPVGLAVLPKVCGPFTFYANLDVVAFTVMLSDAVKKANLVLKVTVIL